MDSLYLSQSKKNAKKENATIVFEDEASFRQAPSLHQTWAVVNTQPKIPSKGERNSQKIFGAVELFSSQFLYTHKQEEYFNHQTYLQFTEKILSHFYQKGSRIYLIQDNASYHKKTETYEWFKNHRKYIEVFNLPPYCPELNATERIWHHTRTHATHNRYYNAKVDLCNALFETFEHIRKNPESISGLIAPFL